MTNDEQLAKYGCLIPPEEQTNYVPTLADIAAAKAKIRREHMDAMRDRRPPVQASPPETVGLGGERRAGANRGGT